MLENILENAAGHTPQKEASRCWRQLKRARYSGPEPTVLSSRIRGLA
ncbi:MAG: hypothetical protein ACLTBV_16770 [Enterocloster bolteae]